MVNLLGTGYVADYCISRFRKRQEEKLYRAYIADALMTLNNNLARAFGGNIISTRYSDLGKPAETRSGDDIAVDIMQRAGLSFAE